MATKSVEPEDLLALCARIRRSGLDEADLEALLAAVSEFARRTALMNARRRRWRIANPVQVNQQNARRRAVAKQRVRAAAAQREQANA
jgi:hypothetical protein